MLDRTTQVYTKCKNYAEKRFCYRLLAALALIIVYSIYIGQLVRASAAPLVMRMRNCQRDVANVRYCSYPAKELKTARICRITYREKLNCNQRKHKEILHFNY